MKSERRIFKIFLHLAGIAIFANGLWMVVAALEWFFGIPADMPATGDPNGHLIRDVGFAYIVFGFALNWCALQLQTRRPVFLMVSFFMVVHALGHLVEILFGLLPASHWWVDFPLVFLPGLVFGALVIPRVWTALVDQSG